MIYLGADHGGFQLKEKIKAWLTVWGYKWEDTGNKVLDNKDDYPKFAFAVAEKVGENRENRGILACRSAAGMVIAANKVKGARAVTAFDAKTAEHCRLHNDANILALSGDWLTDTKAQEILKVWLATKFSGEERHKRRLNELREFEKKYIIKAVTKR